jgi:energy-coupling factor transport system permease protein
MVSMTMQLVPQLARRGRAVRSAYAACTAAGGETGGRHAQVRLSDVLVAWAMEDSLERADSMRARGWGSLPTRTTYRSVEFRGRDALALALSVLLLLANALLASVACGQWHFYPALPRLVAWWGYVPYAALVLLPAALELIGRLRWR